LIFLDTSAIYAMADRGDPRHQRAKERFRALLEAGEGVLTHNYVLVEAMALIQHRLGVVAALKFADSARAFEIEWVDRARHAAAVRRLAAASRRRVSLVDHVSSSSCDREGWIPPWRSIPISRRRGSVSSDEMPNADPHRRRSHGRLSRRPEIVDDCL
jgi:predicted nucleic acid-binding protein